MPPVGQAAAMSTLRSMAEATAPLARAIAAVAGGASLEGDEVMALGPVLRAVGPACCPGAALDVIDVATLMGILQRRPGLLDPEADDDVTIDPEQPLAARGEGPGLRAARAVVDAAVLALEARKLAFGLVAPPAALKVAFASPDEARAVLGAVMALDARLRVAGASPGLSWSPSLPPDREVHVVAGSAARRVLDVLSPSVRRLRVELALAGRRGAVVDDDDVYRGLARLHDSDHATVAERRAADAAEGVLEVDDGGGFVIDSASLVEDLVDRRARSLLLPFKKARVAVIGVVDAADLGRVLGHLQRAGRPPRTVQLLVPSTASPARDDDPAGPDHPGAIVDVASGHVWPGLPSSSPSPSPPSSSRGATLSLPWLGLLPAGVLGDEDAFTLLQACARAALDGPLPPPGLARVVADDSAAALQALATMVQVRPR